MSKQWLRAFLFAGLIFMIHPAAGIFMGAALLLYLIFSQ